MGGFYDEPLLRESVSAVTATNTVELGTRRWNNGRGYVYVYNGGGVAYPGYLMITTGCTGYTCAVTFASRATGNGAGIVLGVVRNVTMTTETYGWIVTNGYTDVYNDGTAAVSAGDLLMPSLNGKVRAFSAVCVITDFVYNCGGAVIRATQATDTAGTIGAYVRLG